MNDLLDSFFAARGMEYVTLDAGLEIVSASPKAYRFADFPEAIAVGNPLDLPFPESIGIEPMLDEILAGTRDSFELKSIGRFNDPDNPIYFDIYILPQRDRVTQEKQLVVLLDDVSERMGLEQKLVQATNETNLLFNALSKSKSYIDSILASMAEALIVTDENGKIKTINRKTQELFEYCETELIGQSIAPLVPEYRALLAAIETEDSGNGDGAREAIEVVGKTKSGKKIYVGFSCSTLEQEQGNYAREFVYIGRDITERKRVQQRQFAQAATTRILSESVSFQQAAPRLLPAICESFGWDVGEIWMTADDRERGVENPGSVHATQGAIAPPERLHCVTSWARSSPDAPPVEGRRDRYLGKGEGLPGWVWENARGRAILDLSQDADAAIAERLRRKIARPEARSVGTGAAFAFPIVGDTDESCNPAEASACHSEILGVLAFWTEEVQTPDPDLMETVEGLASQFGQFIKRKRAETALRESEERYRDLFENASDLILSVDPRGRFLYVNRAWKETLGYSEDDLTRIGLLDIVHPQCKGDYLTHFAHVLRGNILEGIKTELITKSGRKISIEGSLNCKRVDGEAVAVRGIFRDITDRLQSELALKLQQEKTERLLLNILPQTIAERLKRDAATIAEHYADVSVLFADLVGFTRIAAELSPIDLVRLLNQIFSAFDRLTEERGLEKIKTVGDAYMVVGGLPHRRPDHAEAIAQMALDMQAELEQFNLENQQNFNIRIGIHTGPVVAGVIGLKKFIYDLWGDTVNTASRMESHGLPGRIQVTQDTYKRLKDDFILEKRGAIEIKGKGQMITYFLNGRVREQLPSERRRDRLKALKRLGIVSEPTQQLLDMLENRLADSP